MVATLSGAGNAVGIGRGAYRARSWGKGSARGALRQARRVIVRLAAAARCARRVFGCRADVGANVWRNRRVSRLARKRPAPHKQAAQFLF